MAAYTIEDIELIRRKSGISYQEAVALLDYHNGNVARALVDLERNGRIKPEAEATKQKNAASSGKKSSARSGIAQWITKLYRARITVSKDKTTVVNLSALFGIAALIFSPHMVIAGGIASLVLGYKFGFVKNDPAFAGENLDRMVRSAAENVRSSVNDFARGFQSGATDNSAAQSAQQSERSYYAAGASATPQRPSAPTINVPVQVESQDGSVTVEDDSEGYTSATIE